MDEERGREEGGGGGGGVFLTPKRPEQGFASLLQSEPEIFAPAGCLRGRRRQRRRHRRCCFLPVLVRSFVRSLSRCDAALSTIRLEVIIKERERKKRMGEERKRGRREERTDGRT